jgi:hypothetical protein
MKLREHTPVAKISVSQNLRKEPVNQYVQLNNRHSTLPLATMQATTPAK